MFNLFATMINLLPQEDQNKIRQEHIRRLAATAGFILAFIISVSIILLAPAYIFLFFEGQSLKHRLQNFEKSVEKEKIKEQESLLTALNDKVKILSASARKRRVLSDILKEKILDQKTAALKFDAFLYEEEKDKNPERIYLQGRADSRDDFLAFLENLERDPSFNQVISPINNLFQEKDLDFSIIIELADIKNDE